MSGPVLHRIGPLALVVEIGGRWFPANPLAPEHWPPLPHGRRPRALERARRQRLVLEARRAVAGVLVRRIRSLVPPLRACPSHGPKCSGPGCLECLAIARWRVEYEVISGAAATVRRYLFP